MSMRLVTVFGGTGFLGRRVVRHLREHEFFVRIASRHPDRSRKLFGSDDPCLQSVEADIRDERRVADVLAGTHAAVNAVSLYVERGQETFHSVHVEAAKRVAVQAHRVGVERLAHVSGLGADVASPSLYIRKRGEGELAVKAAFTDVILFRPAVTFGPDDAFLTTMLALLRRIDPTRVRRPRGRLGRGAPTQDSASLCPLLQRCENAPIVGQGRAILAPGSADRMHHIACAAGRTASPLLQNLVFGTHRDARLWNAGPRPPRGPHVSFRGTWSQFNPPDVHSAGCLPTLLVQIQVLRPVNRRDRRSPIALRIQGGRPRRDR